MKWKNKFKVKSNVNIWIIGLKYSGKSTVLGSILYKLGFITEDILH